MKVPPSRTRDVQSRCPETQIVDAGHRLTPKLVSADDAKKLRKNKKIANSLATFEVIRPSFEITRPSSISCFFFALWAIWLLSRRIGKKIDTIENHWLWWSGRSGAKQVAQTRTRDVYGTLQGTFATGGRSLVGHLVQLLHWICTFRNDEHNLYTISCVWFLASELPHTSQLRHHPRKNVPCNLSGQNHPSYVDVRGSE